jgi:hypothetical protein
MTELLDQQSPRLVVTFHNRFSHPPGKGTIRSTDKPWYRMMS